MKQVKAIIERASDGTYSVYMDDDTMSYLVTGTGKTEEEAIQCFNNGYEDTKKYYAEVGKPFEECEFVFVEERMPASKYKCCECGKQAVAFWPLIDPDIPSYPYCADHLEKAMIEMAEVVWKDDKGMQLIARERAKAVVDERYRKNKS